MKLKRALLLIFMLIAAGVLGGLVASFCAQVPALSWLAFSRPVGLRPDSPLAVELPMLQFSFSFLVDISVAQLVLVALAVFVYNLITRKK